MQTTYGLVLTGGGARGAYQAGALLAIAEICEDQGLKYPFGVLTGTSAGGINAAYLASYDGLFADAAHELGELWKGITFDQVFNSDFFSLSKTGFRLLLELISGALFKKKTIHSLLNTSPLLKLLQKKLNLEVIQKNIDKGWLKSVALTASNYSTGSTNIFFQGNIQTKDWDRARRSGRKTMITLDHVMASTAIPILFPPIQIGPHYFGDGSLRNTAPLSPAIKLGATKLLVIGVRKNDLSKTSITKGMPSIARILGSMLNSVLLDSIDSDYESLTRVNHALLDTKVDQSVYKPIHVHMLRPSVDIGHLSSKYAKNMPFALTHLVRGLGNQSDAADVISYLLFDPAYTTCLFDIGYKDVMDEKEEIQSFFRD